MYSRIVGSCMIIFSLAIGILCLSLILQTSSVYAFKMEIVGNNHGISIKHDNPLFNIENMVPGETKYSTLEVKSNENDPLKLELDSLMENGDRALFETLIFSIEDSSGRYFSDTLNKLNHIDLGSILKGEKKTYNLSISFPASAGNEFQQKAVSVSFIFTANGGLGSTVDLSEDRVPLASVTPSEPNLTNIPQIEIPTTGESNPKIWYIFGLLLVVVGVRIGLKILVRKDRI